MLSLSTVSDSDLLVGLRGLLTLERRATSDIIAHLAEVDARELYRQEACPSMFIYCVERLHLSDDAAQRRLHASRLAQKFPLVLDYLKSGRLNLTTLNLLGKHLTADNCRDLLDRATHRSKRQVEALCAEFSPREQTAETIREVAVSAHTRTLGKEAEQPPALARATDSGGLKPIATTGIEIRFTANRALKDKLDRAKALLLFHADSDMASIIDRAVSLLVDQLEKKRYGRTGVKRAVYERDNGQCTFTDAQGRRCSERVLLEYDHIIPKGRGGKTTFDNLRLRCRAHNLLAAEEAYGKELMAQFRASG
jgi:hypothetical protein